MVAIGVRPDMRRPRTDCLRRSWTHANRRSNLLWCTTRLFQQCGRMWSSALNTSLAVIPAKAAARLADRFEISVIMLKSELPHEDPNPVSKKAARVHIATRRRGELAARGARAACGLDGSPDRPSVPGNARTTAVRGQLEAFRQGLKEYGWVEGQNIIVEYRFAEGREDALPAIA